MTGYGKAACDFNGDAVSVEISTVNHRYLDCSCRMPSAWSVLESIVRDVVKDKLSRGKINVSITRKRAPSSDSVVRFDAEVARQYAAACDELQQTLGLAGHLSLDTLVQMEGVFYHQDPEENMDEARAMLERLVSEAVESLNSMRLSEGKALALEVTGRVNDLREALARVEERLPALNQLHDERLRARITDLTSEVSVTEERIALEVALLAEKGDVTEEVVRLKTHLDHVLELLASPKPTGRELNFLAQELQREVNTLGVKVRDTEVAREVLSMKAEVEKIREQVQNLE
jgi:uncharacterized protein (TIGR00255 family)